MKKRINLRIPALLTTVCLLAAFSAPTLLRAGTFTETLTDAGTTAPTPGASDVYYLPTGGTTSSQFFYGDKGTPNNASLQYGETFVTGSNAAGYTLNDVYFELDYAYASNQGGALDVPLTIENGDQTAVIAAPTSEVGITGDPVFTTDGNKYVYLEYTFSTPITLSADTTYSLALGYYSPGSGNFNGTLGYTPTNGSAGVGSAFDDSDQSNPEGGVAELVFDAGLTPITAAVPEPATWAMMVGGLGLLVIYQRRRRVNL